MQSFFQTLLRPDHDEHPERALVARAANLLQVGEFQLLQLAYHEWFGFDMPAAQIDRIFSQYMLHNEVPHWARHYARRILDLDEGGAEDLDADPAYHRYDAEYVTFVPKGVQRFCLACMVLAVALIGGIWVGQLKPTEATSVLPPYFERHELRQSR